MSAPRRQTTFPLLSWLGQLWHGRSPRRRTRPSRNRVPLVFELLEDRLTPTTLTDQGGTLAILLDNPGDSFTIKATGSNQYVVSSTNSAGTNDLFSAGLTG